MNASLRGQPLAFDAACEPGERVTIAATGDLLLNSTLQRQAMDDDLGFASLWAPVQPMLEGPDLTYTNFEGTAGCCLDPMGAQVEDPGWRFDEQVYTAHPTFNYHPEVAQALRQSGFDLVSTANNHALDRGYTGVEDTIAALQSADLAWVGTHGRQQERRWYTITEVKGMRLAWVACTNSLNGFEDPHQQVMECTGDGRQAEALVRELSARQDIDAVIVTAHCGNQWDPEPSGRLRKVVQRMVDAGALAVLASGPHDLSYWARFTREDGREAFAAYCMGNFISGQRKLPRRTSALFFLGLTRVASSGQVRINGVRYLPTHMSQRDGVYALEPVDSHQPELWQPREHALSWYNTWNLAPPAWPVDTSPQCDPGWSPPTPWPGGGFGEGCDRDEDCQEGLCDLSLPNRMCTQPCDGGCPRLEGRPEAACVQLEEQGARCLRPCQSDNDCRELYTCHERPLEGDPQRSARVCVPATAQELAPD